MVDPWRSAAWTRQDWAHVLFAKGDRMSPPAELFFGDAVEIVGGDTMVVINLDRPDGGWSAQFRRLPDGRVLSRTGRYDEGLDALADALRPHPGGIVAVLALVDRVIGPVAALRFAAAFREVDA